MFDSPLVVLTMLCSVVGVLAGADTGSLAAASALVAVAAVALALFSSTLSTGSSRASGRWQRPRRAIDVSTLVSQSDPDASGHARPRAPGSAAHAA